MTVLYYVVLWLLLGGLVAVFSLYVWLQVDVTLKDIPYIVLCCFLGGFNLALVVFLISLYYIGKVFDRCEKVVILRRPK